MVSKSMINRSAIAALALVAGTASVANAQQKSREQRIKDQEVYVSTGDEPPSMDPTKQVDTVSYFWLGHIYEGLLSYDKNGNIVPATAESFTVSPDKKTWTFKIRKTAKWQDGKAVRAQDFQYAWRRLVDPAYASEYSFIATAGGLKNAQEIITKKLPKEQLGVKAVDDQTLEVTLSRPVPFFDSLMAFQAFFPVREDLVKQFGDKFANVPESIIGNGAFKMASWKRETSMRLEKADTYWNAAAIKIKAIESPSIIKDPQANFNNFQTGGIDLAGISTPEIIKQAQAAKLKVQNFPSGCVDYFGLNTRTGRVFANQELRQAIELGINRTEYVNKIIGIPGYKASYGVVPEYLPGSKAGSTFGRELPMNWKDADVAGAQKHVKAYLAATKQTKVPAFSILSGDSERAKKYAEYFQNSLAKLLDTTVTIITVPFKTRLQKSRDGDYDLEMSGWCPDYRDAMTYMDLFTSKNDNNTTGWSDKQYDDVIEKANNEADQAARFKLFGEALQILKTQAPVVPTDQTGGAYVIAPQLKGAKRNVFGMDPDFRYASWDQKGPASH